MQNSLSNQNKKILFLSPDFFSYDKKIKEAMEKKGFKVFMHDERCIRKPISKALLKVVPFIFCLRSKRYYRKIIDEYREFDFDYILVIRCDMIPKSILVSFKKSFPRSKLCLYLYDSKKNIKGINKKISLFDFASSFDSDDCEKDKRLHFRPLFYTEDFVNKSLPIKYDLCFCGTIHSDRYYVINKVFNQAKNNGLKTILFSYLPSKFIYYYYKFLAKGFRKAKKNDFSFTKKTINEISMIEGSSNVILDIQHPKQTGLTMRTIEMIGAEKKFITTNKNIIKYDFFDENNILVVDRKRPEIDMTFFDKKYVKIPEHIYKKYSLDQWILDVLQEE